MAQVYKVTEIASLDGLLALFKDQDRCVKFLQEYINLRDEINSRLGDLNTKTKAEAAMAAADRLVAEAGQTKKKAEDELAQARKKIAADLASAKTETDRILANAAAIERDCEVLKAEIQDRTAKLTAREIKVADDENVNAGLRELLDRQRAAIDEERAKLTAKAKLVAEAVAG